MTGADAVLPGAIIVLVEDNPVDVLLIRQALESNHLRTRLLVARDGEEAIRLLDAVDQSLVPCPDLIVVDLNLPKRSGFEVLARARSSGKCGHKPVVILSSSAASMDREKANRLGASGYIRKPSTLKEFLSIGEKLKEMLGGCSR